MEHVQKLISTRTGTIVLAALAALVAMVAIFTYLAHYRSSVRAEGAPVSVLVATKRITQGTPGTAIAAGGLATSRTVRESQLRTGAFADPASLRGQVAAHDIYPGQQLVAGDFQAGAATLASTLSKAERLITVPLDSAHGMTADLQAGDHVDVFAGFNVIPLGPGGVPLNGGQARPMLRLVMQNIPVVTVGAKAAGVGAGQTTNITLRVNNEQAEKLAFGADNGKIWLVLRPAAGARRATPGLVTIETMLLGVRPVTVLRSFGGR